MKYSVFEDKIKIKVPQPDFPDTVSPDPVNPDLTNNIAIPNTESTNKAGLAGQKGASEECFETITYTGRDHKEKTITKSDIHKHLMKKGFPSVVCDAAIAEFCSRKSEVGDVFKLLELIAGDCKVPKKQLPKKHENLYQG